MSKGYIQVASLGKGDLQDEDLGDWDADESIWPRGKLCLRRPGKKGTAWAFIRAKRMDGWCTGCDRGSAIAGLTRGYEYDLRAHEEDLAMGQPLYPCKSPRIRER